METCSIEDLVKLKSSKPYMFLMNILEKRKRIFEEKIINGGEIRDKEFYDFTLLNYKETRGHIKEIHYMLNLVDGAIQEMGGK